MIRYLTYEEIDRQKWDNCISRSVNKIVYGYSWYLDIVCEDWGGLVEDDYQRVMPINQGRKYFVHYIYQPYFTQQLGLFSRALLSPENVSEFLEHLPEKFWYIEMNLNSHNIVNNEMLSAQMRNHELDLIAPYERLKSGFSKNTTRNIRKSEKNNYQLVYNLQPETLISLFKMNKGSQLKHIHEQHYRRLSRLMHTLIHKRMGEIHAVLSQDNEIVAAAFFILKDQRLIFFFSAVSDAGKENGAMFYLIDRCIQRYSGSDFTLDFEGSNDDNLARFYKGWGSKETFYPRIELNRMPWLLKKGHRLVKNIRRHNS